MEILPFLLAPFLASLILTGIHAYLGVHVVERGVIFVDLALAQIAALGATVAILMGMDPHGAGAYWLSLAFTFSGAAVFAFARTRRGHIPQEAFIGIAYAVASATAILAMSKATGETEHLKDMLVGNILAVSMHDVAKTAILYGVVGIFHYIFRKQFLLISTNPEKAEARGMSIRFWDFLFYASFGFVVTSSVAIAGVLLVARRIGNDEFALVGGKEAVGDIDGDALLALGGQAVEKQREVEFAVGGTKPFRVRRERGELIVVEQLRFVQQAADQRALAVIDAAAGEEAQ